MKKLSLLIISVLFAALVLWVLFAPRGFLIPRHAVESAPSANPGDKSAMNAPLRQFPEAAAVSSPTPPHPKGPNAADIYKNAFALYNALTPEEKNMLGKPREEVDAEKAAALFKKIQPIMDQLRQAKDAAYCDWAMGDMSLSKPLPQMNLVMKLGAVARWSAGYQFLASDPEGAISDLSTQLQLGRSVGTQAAIGFLVETSLNQGVINLVCDNAAALSPEATGQALELLRASVPLNDFVQAMNAEAAIAAAMGDQLSNPEMRDQLPEQLKNLQASGSAAQLSDADTVSQMKWCVQVEKDFAAKALLPDAEFNAWWAQVNQQAATQPVAAATLSALDMIRSKYQSAAVNNSMAAAGLAVMQNGPEQLASRLDPMTGMPFAYVQTADGFELRSTFQSKGKPVAMMFSRPAK
jgi:hypothetical protein